MTEDERSIGRFVPGTGAMIGTLCGITLKRLGRGKALWIGGALAMLPVLQALVVRIWGIRLGSDELFVLSTLLLVLLPAMFVGASVGNDLEDGTSTYLWSRPIARWAVLAGKLCALVPIVVVLIVAGWFAGTIIWTAEAPSFASCLALASGGVAISLVAAGIATVIPRHAMAATIGYLLADAFFGAMPFSLSQLSITYHVRTLAGLSRDSPAIAAPLIAMAVIGGVWGSIGLWRIRRLEV
jgi:hypothetical protein